MAVLLGVWLLLGAPRPGAGQGFDLQAARAREAQEAALAAQVHALVPGLWAPEPAARAEAARALWSLGSPAVAPLLERYRDGTPAEQVAIEGVLIAFGPAVLPELARAGKRDYGGGRDPSQYVMWNEALRVAVGMGAPAVPHLVVMLQDPQEVSGLRLFARLALSRMNGLVIDAVAPLLTHADVTVSREAARVLAEVASPAAREALVAGTRHLDPTVRQYSTIGLRRLRDPTLMEHLLTMLGDGNGTVRAAAAGALEAIYDPRLRLPLARLACCDSSTSTRWTVAGVLADARDPRAARLGRRYKAFNISPAATAGIVLTYLLFYGVTAVGLWGLGVVGARRARPSPGRSWRSWTRTAVGAGLLGLVWGGYLQHIVWEAELVLLLLVLPGVGVGGVVLGRLWRRGATLASRAWWLGGIAPFYVGFALGWLWLWGYFGI